MIVLLSPTLIVVGLFLFVIPGLILYAAPSVFFYSLALTLLVLVLRPVGKLRWGLAPALLAFVSFYIPFSNNQETYKRVEQLTRDDVDVETPIKLSGTLALITSRTATFRRSDENNCNRLCQRLLYNGAVDRVMVGVHRKQSDDDFVGTSTTDDTLTTVYFIEKRETCPLNPDTESAVTQRILLGECIVSEGGRLSDAEIIYVTEPVTERRRFKLSARFNLGAVAVSARRKRVIERTDNGYRTLFQTTETKAEPLSHPLILTGIGHGGGSLQMSLGFLRSEFVQNDLQAFAYHEEPRIFGAVTDPVKAPFIGARSEAREFVRRAVLSRGAARQAGHDFFPHYLASFRDRNLDSTPGQDLTPTQDDVDLVLLALKDERITPGFGLRRFNEKLSPVPDELIAAMADRILNTPDQTNVVRSLSTAIGALPAGQGAIISDQILEIFQNDELRSIAWEAVARLGDGEPDAAVYYVSAFRAWYGRNKTKQNLSREDLPRGALIGICLMEERAFSVKDDLLEILRDTESAQISYPIIKALVNMGAVEELKREYEETERWERVLNAIRVKKLYEDKYQKFCGLS
ncbi:hypothetical protein [Denitrobaculum tricleocarpae]|uniref:Uncharacterized protein n=1 Tax=Denitrobaculum tricleocarpae TaxID=2591009 RepID=A0A545TFT8_9PROT|nr:hypothetical protein [Denitrobaculum tricleocarpae]TQV76089.1 hypothetical protein FKG95_20800 [Denitrobaculum tricleocarpae]